MSSPETIVQYWLQKVNEYKETDKVALRQKEFGIWQRFTWDEEYRHVRDICLGLLELGLKRGERVAVIGDNDREYLWAALAAEAAGAVVVGLFTDVTSAEAKYIVTHSDATFVIAGDQEQCDKLLEIKDELPLVKKVIYWDGRGMWHYQDSWLMDLKAVKALGREVVNNEPEQFEATIAKGKKDDLVMFCYTSGTTGRPKGAMLTNHNFISAALAFDQIDPSTDEDDQVSFLPLAWIAGAALDISAHVIFGVILNFAESPETVQQNIREIAPQELIYASRLWENLLGVIQARMNDSSWINRAFYRIFLPIGYRVADLKLAKKPLPLHLSLLYKLGQFALYRPLLNQFGLHQARSTYTVGAALSPDAVRFFQALGLPLRQLYGSTEVTGGALMHSSGDIKIGTVGKPLPGCAMQIAADGEVLLAGPGVFKGYHKNPEATVESIYVDETGKRWFRTGDAGHIDDDGHLVFLDRLKEMIQLISGDKYSPQFIEGRLKFSPYISHVMSIGDQTRNSVTAMITIDFANVGRWAEKHGVAYTTYTHLAQRPEVYELVRKDVETVNATLPQTGQIRRFVLMHKEFDADEGEMTRTRKLRRKFLADRYTDIIDALYSDRPEVAISSLVKYQDGRQAQIDTNLQIESLEAITA